MGGRAEGLACADPGARTPIGASGIFLSFSAIYLSPRRGYRNVPKFCKIRFALLHSHTRIVLGKIELKQYPRVWSKCEANRCNQKNTVVKILIILEILLTEQVKNTNSCLAMTEHKGCYVQ